MAWHLDKLLQETLEKGASDLHLSVGLPPIYRLYGELVPGSGPSLRAEDTAELAGRLLTREQMDLLNRRGDLDLAYTSAGGRRFRINIFRQRCGINLAVRVILDEIPDPATLGLPAIVGHMARVRKGLILVTGPAGCGKSTTLAAMINLINNERSCHIITLEDPIEYLHPPKKSLASQREIGRDSTSFAAGLRAALRQDPDVILVGEMRDLETIAIALTAAETGHLVLSTLHTVDAPQTVDRLIDVFPAHQQQQVRTQLANILVGVISQRLLRRKDGRGLVLAAEVMVANPAIRNLIRENKTYQIAAAMQTGSRQGMLLMDNSIRRLYEQGLVDYQTAMENAVQPENLSKALGYSQGESISLICPTS